MKMEAGGSDVDEDKKAQRELGWTNRGWARRGKLRLSKESTNSGQGKDRVQKTRKRKDYEAAR